MHTKEHPKFNSPVYGNFKQNRQRCLNKYRFHTSARPNRLLEKVFLATEYLKTCFNGNILFLFFERNVTSSFLYYTQSKRTCASHGSNIVKLFCSTEATGKKKKISLEIVFLVAHYLGSTLEIIKYIGFKLYGASKNNYEFL